MVEAGVEDPFLLKEVTEVGDELKEAFAEVDDWKASGNLTESCLPRIPDWQLESLEHTRRVARLFSVYRHGSVVEEEQPLHFARQSVIVVPDAFLPSLFSKVGWPLLSGGQRTTVAYIYIGGRPRELIGWVDSEADSFGSKADSSGSLDFRDIYISILLFRAAYVWIKFRDVIPRGAVYRRPGSNKFEPRIKLPVTSGVVGKSKRIPLGLYNTSAEAEVAYQIAAFYCNKPQHRLGRLALRGGAYFPIPAFGVHPNLPYEEKVKQVGDQVLNVYAEFQERRKAWKNWPTTSPLQQLRRQPLNSRMDLVQPAPNIHNGVDFSNPSSAVLAKTQHELLEAYKQIDCLKARVSRMEVENMGWEVKYSELEHKFSDLQHENGLLNHHIMQSQLQILDPEQDFDPDMLFNMEHEESLAR